MLCYSCPRQDAFEMDRLQEANLKRGYLVGPRSEDEMVREQDNSKGRRR